MRALFVALVALQLAGMACQCGVAWAQQRNVWEKGAMCRVADGAQGDAGTHDEVHEFTKDWHRPSDGLSCCHDHDCRPTVAYVGPDGLWHAMIGRNEDGSRKWGIVQPGALMPMNIPPNNGRSIVCERYGYIYCFRPTEPKS